MLGQCKAAALPKQDQMVVILHAMRQEHTCSYKIKVIQEGILVLISCAVYDLQRAEIFSFCSHRSMQGIDYQDGCKSPTVHACIPARCCSCTAVKQHRLLSTAASSMNCAHVLVANICYTLHSERHHHE